MYPYWGDKELIENLGFAARRGVDVRAILPFESDMEVFQVANRFAARELQESGVKVRWYTRSLLHAKYIVADDMAAIGSSNGDTSRFRYQQDLDVLTADPGFARRFVDAVPGHSWESACREGDPAELEASGLQTPVESALKALRLYL